MSPILFARRKVRTLHMCIDYRISNKQTDIDRYPLPCIDWQDFRLLVQYSIFYKNLDRVWLPLDLDWGRAWVQNCFYMWIQHVWVSCDAFWAHKCTLYIPTFDGNHFCRPAWLVHLGIPWKHFIFLWVCWCSCAARCKGVILLVGTWTLCQT